MCAELSKGLLHLAKLMLLYLNIVTTILKDLNLSLKQGLT